MKLKSSMTLFNIAAPDNDVFVKDLTKHYDGEKDEKTIKFQLTIFVQHKILRIDTVPEVIHKL